MFGLILSCTRWKQQKLELQKNIYFLSYTVSVLHVSKYSKSTGSKYTFFLNWFILLNSHNQCYIKQQSGNKVFQYTVYRILLWIHCCSQVQVELREYFSPQRPPEQQWRLNSALELCWHSPGLRNMKGSKALVRWSSAVGSWRNRCEKHKQGTSTWVTPTGKRTALGHTEREHPSS